MQAAISELATTPVGITSMLVFYIRTASLWLLGLLTARGLDEQLAARVAQLTPGGSADDCLPFAQYYRALVRHRGSRQREQRLDALMAVAEQLARKADGASRRLSDHPPPSIAWETLVVEVTCVAMLEDCRRCVVEWSREGGLRRVACEREGAAALSNLPAMKLMDPVLQWLGQLEEE